MNPSLLVSLVQLKELTVENCTGINFTLNSLANIAKIEVKNSAVLNLSSIFDPLPVTLEVIDVVNVSSQHNATLVLTTTDEGQSAAKRITVVRCGLDSVAVKNMPLLVSLNLSTNSLSESTVRLVNLPALVMLVLSHNAIGAVTHTLLRFESSSLDTIDLSHNRIAYLHPNAFDDAHSLRLVNLSYNLLLNMEDFRPHARLDRIEMDNNPWDCSWLLRAHSSNPTLFRTFRYSKRFDVLSALGLPCLFHISSTDPPNDQGQPVSTTPGRHPQGKIFPRAENISNTKQTRFTITNPLKAIVTIFVGVIISNVILLLYNRYRNILHEPFYRGRSRSAKGVVIEKCTSFWYEVPVSNEATAIPMNHIYEVIREPEPKCEVYDALNFQRDRPPKADDIVDSEGSVS
uniref:Leucine rich immune protein (Coil-less) n=1 Tax=Anopheles culicifacies TaxID=139723 RepID=A0A182MGZ0_9DIPT